MDKFYLEKHPPPVEKNVCVERVLVLNTPTWGKLTIFMRVEREFFGIKKYFFGYKVSKKVKKNLHVDVQRILKIYPTYKTIKPLGKK